MLIVETNTRRITDIDRFKVINRPKWSPDGSKIAVATWSSTYGTDMALPTVVVIDAAEPHRTILDDLNGVLAWAPSSCCLATHSGYYANDIGVVDIETGQYRPLDPAPDYWEGTKFRGWSRDSLSILATEVAHIQGAPAWVHELLLIDASDGRVAQLPLDGPTEEFAFGGFSPDDRQITYGATAYPDSIFQLRIVDTAPGGQSHVGLDLSSELRRLGGITHDDHLAVWSQLRWTNYGIHGTVHLYEW